MKWAALVSLAIGLAMGIGAVPGIAQGGQFELELNSLKPVKAGCRLTFVAHNGTGTDLDKASFEVAVFDAKGAVNRLVILEFGSLRDGRTKVVQFDLASQDCSDISRLLVNNVAECTARDGAKSDCLNTLSPSSRSEVDFGL